MIRRAPSATAAATSSPVPRLVAPTGSFPSAPPARSSPEARALSITATPSSPMRQGASTGGGQRTGDGGRPVRAAERVEGALAAVGQGQLHAGPARCLGGGRDRRGHLRGGGRATELVRGGEERPHRKSRYVPVTHPPGRPRRRRSARRPGS